MALEWHSPACIECREEDPRCSKCGKSIQTVLVVSPLIGSTEYQCPHCHSPLFRNCLDAKSQEVNTAQILRFMQGMVPFRV
jgi:DNA-directed RNA polymerase subunit RPC12/RpoP